MFALNEVTDERITYLENRSTNMLINTIEFVETDLRKNIYEFIIVLIIS